MRALVLMMLVMMLVLVVVMVVVLAFAPMMVHNSEGLEKTLDDEKEKDSANEYEWY